MADKSATENAFAPSGGVRSTKAGDIPETLARRYYLDGRGGPGTGFYTDARIKTAAFRDRGRSLIAVRTDPKSIRDMAAIAHHRGWSTIVLSGAVDFRREAWLASRANGIEVRGYKPTDRDLQDLERRHRRGGSTEHDPADRESEAGTNRRSRSPDPSSQLNLRVIEAVVRERVKSPEARERILGNARERLETWLERGARLAPLEVNQAERSDRVKSSSRSRGR